MKTHHIARALVALLLSAFSLQAFSLFFLAPTQARASLSLRKDILSGAKLPAPIPLPVPQTPIALPADWSGHGNAGVPPALSIRFSNPPPGDLFIRRISNNDGLLYLEIYCLNKKLTGDAEIQFAGKPLARANLDTAPTGSLWFSLKPKIGKITVIISRDGKTSHFAPPTTLVEIRDRQIFLNGEPFLMKGVTGGPEDAQVADYIRTIGINTLRGSQAARDAGEYAFMSIASANPLNRLMAHLNASADVFEREAQDYLASVPERTAEARENPNVLILQLGNEVSDGDGTPPGKQSLNTPRVRLMRMLVATRNIAKQFCPMLPTGYANHDKCLLIPDALDVYMHNTFLEKDRAKFPLKTFLELQGSLPPSGPGRKGRPLSCPSSAPTPISAAPTAPSPPSTPSSKKSTHGTSPTAGPKSSNPAPLAVPFTNS